MSKASICECGAKSKTAFHFFVCPLYNTARVTLFKTIYQAIPLLVPTIDTLLFLYQRLTITQNSSIISAVHNNFLTTKRLQQKALLKYPCQ